MQYNDKNERKRIKTLRVPYMKRQRGTSLVTFYASQESHLQRAVHIHRVQEFTFAKNQAMHGRFIDHSRIFFNQFFKLKERKNAPY